MSQTLSRPVCHRPHRLRGVGRAAACAAAMLVAGLHASAWAAETARAIYTCTDAGGKRHTSDRPITECLDREQRVLNKDGSQRKVMPPRMTAEERAAAEERQRELAQADVARKDAVRRDRNLMMRFPTAAAHNKGREAAMDDLRKGIQTSESRLKVLQGERRPLEAEAEFYKGKRLPNQLRAKLEANDAQQQAQQDIIQNQKSEMVRLNALYDAELARLKKLWAGAPPGSVPMDAAGADVPR